MRSTRRKKCCAIANARRRLFVQTKGTLLIVSHTRHHCRRSSSTPAPKCGSRTTHARDMGRRSRSPPPLSLCEVEMRPPRRITLPPLSSVRPPFVDPDDPTQRTLDRPSGVAPFALTTVTHGRNEAKKKTIPPHRTHVRRWATLKARRGARGERDNSTKSNDKAHAQR